MVEIWPKLEIFSKLFKVSWKRKTYFELLTFKRDWWKEKGKTKKAFFSLVGGERGEYFKRHFDGWNCLKKVSANKTKTKFKAGFRSEAFEMNENLHFSAHNLALKR